MLCMFPSNFYLQDQARTEHSQIHLVTTVTVISSNSLGTEINSLPYFLTSGSLLYSAVVFLLILSEKPPNPTVTLPFCIWCFHSVPPSKMDFPAAYSMTSSPHSQDSQWKETASLFLQAILLSFPMGFQQHEIVECATLKCYLPLLYDLFRCPHQFHDHLNDM